MHTEHKIHCGTLVFRRSGGTDAQQLKNGCRVKLIHFIEASDSRPYSKVLQKHGKYKHNDAIAQLLADDLDARAKAARQKSKRMGAVLDEQDNIMEVSK